MCDSSRSLVISKHNYVYIPVDIAKVLFDVPIIQSERSLKLSWECQNGGTHTVAIMLKLPGTSLVHVENNVLVHVSTLFNANSECSLLI